MRAEGAVPNNFFEARFNARVSGFELLRDPALEGELERGGTLGFGGGGKLIGMDGSDGSYGENADGVIGSVGDKIGLRCSTVDRLRVACISAGSVNERI